VVGGGEYKFSGFAFGARQEKGHPSAALITPRYSECVPAGRDERRERGERWAIGCRVCVLCL
jgi:hypothetical protein